MSGRTVSLAKRVLTLRPTPPPDPAEPGGLQEIFRHPRFTDGTPEERRAIMDASCEWKHRDEHDYPWDHYFGRDLTPELHGKTLLDLGCFTGGRSVAWAERYQVARMCGIDVDEPFLEAARRYAADKGFETDFRSGIAEAIPYPDASFDAVLSFDVFEHVQDVAAGLAECFRVLRPGGRLYVVFPGYFHPVEHHLSFATRLPGVHYLFSGATLVAAYTEILQERGPEHGWYARRSPQLHRWERGHTINGMTFGRFRRIVRDGGWLVHRWSRLPILRVGRSATRRATLRTIGALLTPLACLPVTREFVLHRITATLQRPK